jgi:8-oxo-dGTP pyrophosphatase MutT (NUDIX family)
MKSRGGIDSSEPRAQYAALPWRRAATLEILLVSSRETRRWVLPKGWPMKGRKPHAAAAREALEEAGIIGKIAKAPIGSYHYVKRMKNGAAQPCEVKVFPFEVERERKSWPEKHERIRKWFAVADAADAVHEPELRDVILEFGAIGETPPK